MPGYIFEGIYLPWVHIKYMSDKFSVEKAVLWVLNGGFWMVLGATSVPALVIALYNQHSFFVLLCGVWLLIFILIVSYRVIRSITKPEDFEALGLGSIEHVPLQKENRKIDRNHGTGAETIPAELLQPATESPRIISDITPEYLFSFYQEYTVAQARRLADAYVDKWIQVSGTVQNVVEELDHWQVFIQLPNGPRGTLIFAYFRRSEWIRRIEALRKGDSITVFGRIAQTGQLVIWLEDCETREPDPLAQTS